jgi:hypothetical protein
MDEIKWVREYCEAQHNDGRRPYLWEATWREALAVIETVANAEDPNSFDDFSECIEALDAWRTAVQKWEKE